MQLLDFGIIGCFIFLAYEIGGNILCCFPCNVKSLKRTWRKLGLYEYKIKECKSNELQKTFKVIIPLGKSYDDFVKLKGMLEKAYSCKCEIKDEEYSNYVHVTLTYKEN